MPGNSFGQVFRLTTFGESHGDAIGGIIDGCPAGLALDMEFIRQELQRRKPGQSRITTQRKEEDDVQLLSGIYEGKTTGTPIGFMLANTDSRSKDYDHLKEAYRPSHADYTYDAKYGHRDHRGGGRSSARETACRVVAGAIAKQFLALYNIKIQAYVSRVGPVKLEKSYRQIDYRQIESNIVRCPDPATAEAMIQLIEQVRKEGDTIGGIITCLITGSMPGMGEPVFDKLNADLAKAMLSINAAKGFELGTGFDSVQYRGSELNDRFIRKEDGHIGTLSNNSGGIQGGISNGEPIYFNVAFKPVATILRDQESVDAEGNPTTLKGKGRHDPCVVPRAVPIVESMAALVLADHLLRFRSSRI